jgi:hypothetical protein
MQKCGREWLLEHICRPHLHGAEPEEIARELLEQELKPLDSIADADFRLKVLKTNQWAHRWTLASLRAYQPAAFARTPFLDPRIIDFFCTIPTSMVRGRRLQIEFLKRFAPDLARVRWQLYGVNLFRHDRHYQWVLPTRALRKLRRVIGGKRPAQRNWEVQFLSAGQWQRLEGALLDRRRRIHRIHDLVEPAAIRPLLRRLASERSAADGYSVSMLLTFSEWLEWHGEA